MLHFAKLRTCMYFFCNWIQNVTFKTVYVGSVSAFHLPHSNAIWVLNYPPSLNKSPICALFHIVLTLALCGVLPVPCRSREILSINVGSKRCSVLKLALLLFGIVQSVRRNNCFQFSIFNEFSTSHFSIIC